MNIIAGLDNVNYVFNFFSVSGIKQHDGHAVTGQLSTESQMLMVISRSTGVARVSRSRS